MPRVDWTPDPRRITDDAAAIQQLKVDKSTDSEDWGASFRQNVVGMRSMQVEHEDRNMFSTFIHDAFGIWDKPDYNLDKMGEDAQALIQSVPEQYQRTVFEEENLPDMKHRVGMINSDLDDEAVMNNEHFLVQLGMGMAAMPLDPLTYAVFAGGTIGRVGKLMNAAYGPAKAPIIRKAAVDFAQGATEGAISEMLIKNASTEDYSGVVASALMSGTFAGGISGAARFISRHGGNAQKEIMEKMGTEEMDISVDRENVIESMKILDTNPANAAFKKIIGIPVAKWTSKLSANPITGRWTSSDMNTIIADSTDPTKGADGATASLAEITKHDTTHIGMQNKDGKEIIQNETNVQDIKYENMYYNIKLEMARGKNYNDYRIDWESKTPEEKTEAPKMSQQDWSTAMHYKRAQLFDEYNNFKTRIDHGLRQDATMVKASEALAESKIEAMIQEYNFKKLQEDKKYTMIEREDVDDVTWAQHMEDVFGGRDKIDAFREGWEESFFRTESTKQAMATHESKIELQPWEKEFIDSGNTYYKGKADSMKKNGLDEFQSFDSHMYNPRVWKGDVMLKDKDKAYTDMEEAIRDSEGYKLMFQDATKGMDDAIALGNQTGEITGQLKQLVKDIQEIQSKIDEQEAMIGTSTEDAVFKNILDNRPFHVDIDPGKKNLDIGSDEYHVGDFVSFNTENNINHGIGKIQGFDKNDNLIILTDTGEITRSSPMEVFVGNVGKEFYDNFAKVRARHEVESVKDIFSKDERSMFNRGFFQRKDVQALWNAAGRPEISLTHLTGPMHKTSGYVGGYYTSSRNKIRLGTYNISKAELGETFMHELVHAMTVQQLDIDPQFKADIDDIFQQLQARPDLARGDAAYGFTDAKEMLSEMFSNPIFIKKMMEIPATNKYGEPTGDSIFDTILATILKQVRKIMPKTRQTNLHDAAMNVFYNFEKKVDQTATYRQSDLNEAELQLNQRSRILRIKQAMFGMNVRKVDELSYAEWQDIFSNIGRGKDHLDMMLDSAAMSNRESSAEPWFTQEMSKVRRDIVDYLDMEQADLDAQGVKSYDELLEEVKLLNRMGEPDKYREGLMKASKLELEGQMQVLANKLKEAPQKVQAARAEMSKVEQYPKQSARGVVDRITAPTAKTISGSSMDGAIPAFGKRTVNINESHPALTGYMHNNEATVNQMYDYKTTGKIATQDVFGTTDRAEYEKHVRTNVTNNDKYVSMLGDMFDRGLGTKQLPADPNNGFERLARVIANWNYLTMGGQFAKYGLAEMGATIHSVGFRGLMQSIPAFKQTISMYKSGQMPSAEMETNMRLADAGEIYKGNNMAALGDATDIASNFAGENMGAMDKVEGWSKRMSQFMFRGSGLEASTVWTKLVLPKAFMGRILDQVSRSQIDGRSMQDMARWGLGADDLIAISKENFKANKNGMVEEFNLDGWKDQDLAKRFERAVHRMSRDTIMRPDANRLPNWLTDGSINPIVKMAKQFMSFMFVSHERLLMRGMNERQGHAAMSVLASFAFLAMFETISERVAIATGILDEDDAYYTSDDPEKFKAAMMRLGELNSYAGLGPTAFEFGDLLFGDGYGNKARTMGKVAGGPMLSRISKGKRAVSDIIEGKYGEKALYDFTRTSIPFTNLLGLDYMAKEKIFREERLED